MLKASKIRKCISLTFFVLFLSFVACINAGLNRKHISVQYVNTSYLTEKLSSNENVFDMNNSYISWYIDGMNFVIIDASYALSDEYSKSICSTINIFMVFLQKIKGGN